MLANELVLWLAARREQQRPDDEQRKCAFHVRAFSMPRVYGVPLLTQPSGSSPGRSERATSG